MTITQKPDSDAFAEIIFKLIKNKFRDLDNEMEESRFNFKFAKKLKDRCKRINEWKGSAYIKSIIRLRCKNITINPKTVDDRCFYYALALTQHYKEIKKYHKRVSNIKIVT